MHLQHNFKRLEIWTACRKGAAPFNKDGGRYKGQLI